MAVVVKKPKVSDFLSLTKFEEFAPKGLTRLKTVSISTRDVKVVRDDESLSDINLLNNVPIDKCKYVGILGVVVTGEWLLPDFVRGGVTISFVDKRLTSNFEAVLGTYRAAAKDKRFQFKLIPNYFVTVSDAGKNPWQMYVKIKGLRVEPNWEPLSIEVVSVVMCSNSVVTKGLRERLVAVGDANVELSEKDVDDFVDSVPVFKAIGKLRFPPSGREIRKDNRVNFSKGVNKNKVVSREPESIAGPSTFNLSKKTLPHSINDALSDHESESVSILRDGVGRADSTNESLYDSYESTVPDSGRARRYSRTVLEDSD